MPLILPNDIANDQLADGERLQQNYSTIEDWANEEVVNRDGSVAMTGALLLPGAPTQPNQAATKAYVDSAVQTVTTRVSWANVVFQNGWENWGASYFYAQYSKIGSIVYMRGTIKRPAGDLVNQPMFTLPVGFRAGGDMIFGQIGGSGIVRVDIKTSGLVTPNGGAGFSNFVSFDGMVWEASG